MVMEFVTMEFDEILAQTDKAILFLFGSDQAWIAKSLIEELDEEANQFAIPEWVMLVKGLEMYGVD
jgi:hypothetical protein